MVTPAPVDPNSAAHAAALSHMDALPPGTRLGEFELRALLGVGGFGMVYAAFDHSLQRPVAIKEYMPSGLAGRSAGPALAMRSMGDDQTFQAGLTSFINEARLLAQFDHPSLVKVYRFWEANNTAYMAMPLYRGMTLNEARKHMRTPPSEAWLRLVLASVLGALEVLHKANTTHRDVSPDNIFLQDMGPPVLLDLGAARRAISDRSHRHTAILKINYAPIEQYADARDMRQGPWTDIYSLAAVVHGCLCNEAPLPATFRVLRDRLQPVETVVRTVAQVFGQSYSPEFSAALAHGLAIRPEDRPQDVGTFASEMGLDRTQDLSRFDWRAELGDIYSTVPVLVDAPVSDSFAAERLTQPMTTVPQALLPPVMGASATAVVPPPGRTAMPPGPEKLGLPPEGSAAEWVTPESLVTGPAPLEEAAERRASQSSGAPIDVELDAVAPANPRGASLGAAMRPPSAPAVAVAPAATAQPVVSPLWWGVGLVVFLVLAFSLINLARAPKVVTDAPQVASGASAAAGSGIASVATGRRDDIVTETATTPTPVAPGLGAPAVPRPASGAAPTGGASAPAASSAPANANQATTAQVGVPARSNAAVASAGAPDAAAVRSPPNTGAGNAAAGNAPGGNAAGGNAAPSTPARGAGDPAARPAAAAGAATGPTAVPSASGAPTNVATGGVLGQQATARPGSGTDDAAAPASAIGTASSTPSARALSPREPTAPPCGDASVFGRPMCLHRECQRPEHTGHRQCVEHRDLLERSKRQAGPVTP
jgi:serine/threonine protein kinase